MFKLAQTSQVKTWEVFLFNPPIHPRVDANPPGHSLKCVREAENGMTSPMFYQIRVHENLSSQWTTWFEEMTIEHLPDGETILSGALPDQAALHGVLCRINDLGLTLIALSSAEQAPANGQTFWR